MCHMMHNKAGVAIIMHSSVQIENVCKDCLLNVKAIERTRHKIPLPPTWRDTHTHTHWREPSSSGSRDIYLHMYLSAGPNLTGLSYQLFVAFEFLKSRLVCAMSIDAALLLFLCFSVCFQCIESSI